MAGQSDNTGLSGDVMNKVADKLMTKGVKVEGLRCYIRCSVLEISSRRPKETEEKK